MGAERVVYRGLLASANVCHEAGSISPEYVQNFDCASMFLRTNTASQKLSCRDSTEFGAVF